MVVHRPLPGPVLDHRHRLPGLRIACRRQQQEPAPLRALQHRRRARPRRPSGVDGERAQRKEARGALVALADAYEVVAELAGDALGLDGLGFAAKRLRI